MSFSERMFQLCVSFLSRAHHPDRERHMVMIGTLPEPIRIDVTTTERFRERRSKDNKDEIEFSMTSVLNQRPTDIVMDGLSSSRLNMRYIKQKAPNPPITNGVIIHEIEAPDTGLATSKLNSRYITDQAEVYDEDLSANSKLNARYVKSAGLPTKPGAKGLAAADRIARRQNKDRGLEKASASSDNISVGTGHSDWSHWVEDVFNNALNEHVDALSDARSVEHRLKGGGKGVPDQTLQQVSII